MGQDVSVTVAAQSKEGCLHLSSGTRAATSNLVSVTMTSGVEASCAAAITAAATATLPQVATLCCPHYCHCLTCRHHPPWMVKAAAAASSSKDDEDPNRDPVVKNKEENNNKGDCHQSPEKISPHSPPMLISQLSMSSNIIHTTKSCHTTGLPDRSTDFLHQRVIDEQRHRHTRCSLA